MKVFKGCLFFKTTPSIGPRFTPIFAPREKVVHSPFPPHPSLTPGPRPLWRPTTMSWPSPNPTPRAITALPTSTPAPSLPLVRAALPVRAPYPCPPSPGQGRSPPPYPSTPPYRPFHTSSRQVGPHHIIPALLLRSTSPPPLTGPCPPPP